MRMPDLPHPPPAYDEQQLPALNDAWQIAAPPSNGGWKKGLASVVWRIVGPSLQKQTAFNSRLVDHLNRNVVAHREAQRAAAATLALVRDQLSDLIAFQSQLAVYLQQITAYVDTRDREASGRALIVNAAVNGVADDLAKRWESMVAREQRYDARVASVAATHEELRTLIGISQQATIAMKREMERVLARGDRPSGSEPHERTPPASGSAFAPALDAYKYVGFEDQFRGSQDAIRARLESYVPYFAGASNVLDVGCGRGEFLDLLAARGIAARGIDLNHEMVEVCRARGLDVTEADLVTYLEALPDGSLGGLFAAQVVEHLQPAYLLRALELARHKLRPGAPIVLETLNPACWVAFFDSFIRDITHVWPLHPETLRYLVLASGFTSATIEFRSPVAPEDRLQTVPPADGSLADLIEAFNANVEKLNARLFTYLDYAIVGRTAST
jgi:SAM-dependent methyltransferase